MSDPQVVPHHIAIVMDGNGRSATRRVFPPPFPIVRDANARWPPRRWLPRRAGHQRGVEALRRCARACVQRGVAVLTVFAFSSENWNRPADEVSGLLELLALAL